MTASTFTVIKKSPLLLWSQSLIPAAWPGRVLLHSRNITNVKVADVPVGEMSGLHNGSNMMPTESKPVPCVLIWLEQHNYPVIQ